MDSIAILIPTYGRAERLAKLSKDIHAVTTLPHTIYFVVESTDAPSVAEAGKIEGDKVIVVSKGTYVDAVNIGYKSTTEPFVMCGSDDIVFTKDWDTIMVRGFDNPEVGLVGAKDEWTITKTLKHASHFMVRREYIKTQSGVNDEPDVIYSSQYIHTMCDIETEQTAMGRGAFYMSDAVIHHLHWFMGTALMDETYKRPQVSQQHDMDVYNTRRDKFELYKFEDLFAGKITPMMGRNLTVVIPSFNQMPYLKQTVESLKKNTATPYELIIIDDNSNKETTDYIHTLDCVKIFNTKQAYVNANWNKGIELASNRHICIANNDITFSYHWDVPLIEELKKKDVWIASPYQTDDGWNGPAYRKHERSGNINLRGSCFMLKKEMIDTCGYIPVDMLIWFGDWWIVWEAEKHNKKSVFSPSSVIHHYGSKSSVGMMQEQLDLFQQILRGDAYAFHIHTGINVDKWLKIIYGNLKLPCPV
jgi:glycosyltransferase involved in cell wall biosynthesis